MSNDETGVMQFKISEGTEEIPRLAEEVETFLDEAGLDGAIAMSINLCLDELLTNTIHYGYESKPSKYDIAVSLTVEDNDLTIEIVDDAAPFDPTTESQAPDLESALEERRVGGLGIHLAKTLSDKMDYQLDALGRNHLTILKRI